MRKGALGTALVAVGLLGAATIGGRIGSVKDGAPASIGSAERIHLPGGPLEVAVRGRGPTVLVLHGTPGGFDQGLWLAREVLGPGFTVLAPSRPGYLGTPLDGRGEPAAQADLLAELLRTRSAEDAVVLAWSGGGPTAVELAARHPELVRGLVLLAPALRATSIPPEPPSDLALRTAALLLRWAPALVADRVTSDTIVARRLVEDSGVRARMVELVTTLVSSGRREAGRSADRDALLAGRPALHRVSAPTLVVHGSEDERAPLADARRAADRIPDARTVIVREAGHIFTLHPAFARHLPRIRTFIREPTSRSGARP